MSNNIKETDEEIIEKLATQDYEFGFVTDIDMDIAKVGLDENTIRFISEKKNEPEWMLEWRLKGYRAFEKAQMPTWQYFEMPKIDFQKISYYAAPKKKKQYDSLDEVDPELIDTFNKLGISLNEQKHLAGVAVDVVFDSVSVATTYKKQLNDLGIIFCSISEAIQEHPELIQKYLGSVVPHSDNIFAALNAAVFSDGSFVYIPKNVRCPIELSTYFRINSENTGQFERTLIIADEGSYVSYLEGCT
ncbi:MAG TPA: Fe-S cluster assembly protein SufB, partial [Arachidicoccus sp.]